mgnify:CR=1 FL=1
MREITCQIESINLALREAADQGLIVPDGSGEEDPRNFSHVPRTEEEEAGGRGPEGAGTAE